MNAPSTPVRLSTGRLWAAAAASSLTWPALAVPYASGVRDLGGGTFEFVLNQAADRVEILRDGGNAIELLNPGAGAYSFDMTGFTGYAIAVEKSAPRAWTRANDAALNAFAQFKDPTGLAINTNPNSAFFGSVYVANDPDSNGVAQSSRILGDGIYRLRADLIDADGFTADDPAAARVPVGWASTAGVADTPFRMAIDDNGYLIVGDRSVGGTGGLLYSTPDLATGGRVVTENNTGAINSRPNLTGSLLGGDLQVIAIDAETPGLTGGNQHIWRWDAGGLTPGGNDVAPDLLVDNGLWPNSSNGRAKVVAAASVLLDLDVVELGPDQYRFYQTQYRFNGDEPGLMVIEADASDADPNNWTQTLVFDSFDFTQAQGLDSFVPESSRAGLQDILRANGTPLVSPDGRTLFLRKVGVQATNDPIFGTVDADGNPLTNPQPFGVVYAIELDANGLPILTDANGNFDRSLITEIQVSSPQDFTVDSLLELDAAGNLYTTNRNNDQLDVLSPGGNTRTILSFDGSNNSFLVEALVAAGLAGDFDGSGSVEQGDLDLVLTNWGVDRSGFKNDGNLTSTQVDQEELDLVLTNWGTSASPSFAGYTVPEPGAVAVLATGAALALRRGRRGR